MKNLWQALTDKLQQREYPIHPIVIRSCPECNRLELEYARTLTPKGENTYVTELAWLRLDAHKQTHTRKPAG